MLLDAEGVEADVVLTVLIYWIGVVAEDCIATLPYLIASINDRRVLLLSIYRYKNQNIY